jgi:hypothetical protein
MFKEKWSPEEIDKELSSSFDGDDDSIEIFENYTGENDEFIESYSGKGLLDLDKSTKRFALSIENTTSTAKQLVLTPGNYPVIRAAAITKDSSGKTVYKAIGGKQITAPDGYSAGDVIILYDNPEELIAAGHRIDCVADDGIVFSDATGMVRIKAAKQEARLRYFLEFIRKNPTLFAGMHINSDNTAQFETELILRRTSPYAVYGEERIPFQDGFRPSNMNVDKIIIEHEFQFDGETLAIVTIPAKTKSTFTFVAGAVSSQAISLKKKFSFAKTGIRRTPFVLREHLLPKRRFHV